MEPVPYHAILEHNRIIASVLSLHELPVEPALRLAVVTCMDARIDLRRLLGIKEGDVHHLRNAGGIVTDDMLRSLVISQLLLGTRSIMLVQHTECGMLRFRDEDLYQRAEAETGERPPFPLGAFEDLEESVRDSMARLRATAYLPHREEVRGFVLDIERGRLREVPTTPVETV